MKLSVLTTTISRNAGGLFESVRHLHGSLAQDVPTQILALRDEFTEQDLAVWGNLDVQIYPHVGPRSLSYSPAIQQALEQAQPDIVHVHGIWQGPSMASNQYYRQTKRPHVISPRGMLDPWAFKNSRWKKELVGRLFEYHHLHTAACMHALCESEAVSMRQFGLKTPICVVPNAVNFPEDQDVIKTGTSGSKKLLFLGRIHPKKGLLNALRAWKKSRAQSTKEGEAWQFVIAGWGQGGHEAELKQLCDELSLSYADVPVSQLISDTSQATDHCSVVFVGSAFGEEKEALLRHVDAFILPSFSEGLPMSVLEAWSYRLPVVMTEYCNLPEGFDANAAVRIDTDVDSISAGLCKLFRLSSSELEALASHGRTLVETKFTWPQVAAEMKHVYEWVLGGGKRPKCIIDG